MVKLHLEQVSAKVRNGPPLDEDEDLSTNFWSGVIPVGLHYGAPEPDPTLHVNIPVPPHIRSYHRDVSKGGDLPKE